MNKTLDQFLSELMNLSEEIKSTNGLVMVELSPTGQTSLTPDDMKGLKAGRHFTPDGIRGLAFSSTKKIFVFSEMTIHSDAMKKILPSFPRKVKDAFTMGLIFPFIAAFTSDGKLEDIGDLFSPENFDPDGMKRFFKVSDSKELVDKLIQHWGWMSFVFPDIRQAFRRQIMS